MPPLKDLADKRKAWDTLSESLKSKGVVIQTWSRSRGNGCYFHAIVSGDSIIVSGTPLKAPSCNIKSGKKRSIDYAQFEQVANIFEKYVTGETSRMDMLKLGWNSSYIISLIMRLL
jgi:hypothetical protein